MRFYNAYQYLAPLVLGPLSYWLWWLRYDRSHACVLLMLSMPVLFAYIIPGVGTNLLGLWEFNTRFRLGKFRPHHGFVFGSATALLTYLCIDRCGASVTVPEILRTGLVLGSVLGFWNWYYDMRAIDAGFLIVYNQPFAQRKGAEAIAADYAPVIFASFGFCYGCAIRVIELCLLEHGGWKLYGWLLLFCNLIVLTVPVAMFMGYSFTRHGHFGLTPFRGD